MITAHYANKKGVVVAVFHRAGNVTVDGAVRKDEKYLWTHPFGEKCVACENGTIPADIKKGL